MMENIDATQATGIVLIALFLIKEIFSFLNNFLKNRNSKNSDNNVAKLINVLKENDLKDISKKIDTLNDKIDAGFKEVTNLLIEIREKIKK